MHENLMNSVAAVVVTYNRKELLKECIDSLLLQTFNNLNILIIDNASTDGTCDFIKDYIENNSVNYFNTGNNLGGAGGFNFGVRKAAELNYDYIWLMDDDTITMPNSLYELMNAAKTLDYNFGFLSSYSQFIDGTPCVMNIQGIKGYSWIYAHDYINYGLIAINRATFVSLLIPKKVVSEKGLPIKDFFIWSDDTEYTKRISRDYPCFFVNKSIVIHKTTTNSGATNESFIQEKDVKRLDRYQYKFRNLFFVAKEEGKREVIHYCYTFIKLNIKCLLYAKNYRLKKLIILWRGFFKGIFFNPSIETID